MRDPMQYPAIPILAVLLAASSAAQDLLVRDVTVVSPERTSIAEHRDVLIRDGRIAAIEPTSGADATVPTLDGRGRYLVPGLIDSHVHLYHATGLKRKYTARFQQIREAYLEQLPRSLLFFGYTSVIELNADFDVNRAFTARAVHPRLFHCGQGVVLPNGFMALEMPPGTLPSAYPNYLHDVHGSGVLPDGADAAQHTPAAVVAAIRDAGGIGVKLYYEQALWSPGGPPEFALPSVAILREVVEEAHRAGLVTILHATAPEGHAVAVEAGVDIVAHGLWDWPDVAFDAPDTPPGVTAILERQVAAGIGIQPTLRTLRNTASMFDPASLDDPRLADVLPPAHLEYLRGEAQAQRADFVRLFGATLPAASDGADIRALQSAFNARYERLTGTLDASGARLLFGTDTAVGGFGWGNPPGLNGYWEMEGWERGGVGLRSIFAAATLRNAEAFGLDDELGSVEVGKRADLLLLAANPLETVTAYDSIETILLGGVPLAREELSARRDAR